MKFINEARELGIEVLRAGRERVGLQVHRASATSGSASASARFATSAGRRSIRFSRRGASGRSRRSSTSAIASTCALCNKRVFEALIASGALDTSADIARSTGRCSTARCRKRRSSSRRRRSGQVSLFGGADDVDAPSQRAARAAEHRAAERSERLTKEKEILGFYISGHPLEPFRMECELFATHTVSRLGKWTDQSVSLGVVVTAVKQQISKRSGAEFARLTVEDFSGSSEVLVFPEAWTMLADRVKTDVPVLLKGSYSRRDQDVENPTFIVESLTPFVELRLNGAGGGRDRVDVGRAT